MRGSPRQLIRACLESDRRASLERTAGRNFWMELLDGTFGWNFWMELLDGTFGWNFWMELLDGTFGWIDVASYSPYFFPALSPVSIRLASLSMCCLSAGDSSA